VSLRRNLTDPESRAFWESVDRTAKEVRRWPGWMRGECERGGEEGERGQLASLPTDECEDERH